MNVRSFIKTIIDVVHFSKTLHVYSIFVRLRYVSERNMFMTTELFIVLINHKQITLVLFDDEIMPQKHSGLVTNLTNFVVQPN